MGWYDLTELAINVDVFCLRFRLLGGGGDWGTACAELYRDGYHGNEA